VIQIAEALVRGLSNKEWHMPSDGCVTTEKMAYVTLPGLFAREWVIVIVDGGFDYIHQVP
jgi:hypothetical protein